MEVKATASSIFASAKEGVGKMTATIQSPETQEKIRNGASKLLAGIVSGINLITYTGASAIVAAKNGLVDGVSETDKSTRR